MNCFDSTKDRRPGVVYVDIHPPARHLLPPGCQTISELKPQALTEIDNVLWSNLVDVLNPIVYKLNRGNRVLFTVMVLFFIAFISTIFLGFFYVEVWMYIVFAVIFMVSQLSILGWNQKLDRQLCEIVVTEFQSRFAAQGHELRYVTSNTGLCIGKNATIERFLEFPRTMVAEATAIVVNAPSTTNDYGSQNNTNNTTTGVGTENTTINNTDYKVAVALAAVVVEDDIEKNNTTNRNLPSTSKASKSEVKAENVDNTNTYSSTMNSNPSVVDQMMTDLHRPL